MYIGRAYEQIVPVKDRYRRQRIELPNPEFYTFYNGTEPYKQEEILRLSDAYKIQQNENMLELSVKVINIKSDENHEILDKCSILKEYSLFIEHVQKHRSAGEEEAVKNAIKECIEKGILADYLKRKGSQVNNMLIAEYDYELDIQVQREEAEQIGMERGKKEGIKEGEVHFAKLTEKLLQAGRTEELLRATNDNEFRDAMYREYGIK